MALNDESKVEYEAGVVATAMSALTDSGDHVKYTSAADLWSEDNGVAPVILPNGVINGGDIIPGISGSNNKIDVSTILLNLNGVETTVAGSADITVTRASTDVASITSVTVDSGGSIVLVKGTDSLSAAFSETRGVAGGPPLIAVDSVEIGQVRTTSNVAAEITAAEILQIEGNHKESAYYPVYTQDNSTGSISFNAALPLIHTGPTAKKVFASYAEPVFSEQSYANDFVPAEETHSVSSQQVYQSVLGTASKSLGQASFTAILRDGVTDPILSRKNRKLWFRFTQNRYKSAHILTQGILGISRTFNAAGHPNVTCTISSDIASIERAS